ncbi:hypothetical protein KEM55_004940, partial [Ascosphaera atra]
NFFDDDDGLDDEDLLALDVFDELGGTSSTSMSTPAPAPVLDAANAHKKNDGFAVPAPALPKPPTVTAAAGAAATAFSKPSPVHLPPSPTTATKPETLRSPTRIQHLPPSQQIPSSQPLPWSSSPPHHYHTTVQQASPSKRARKRTLPWSTKEPTPEKRRQENEEQPAKEPAKEPTPEVTEVPFPTKTAKSSRTSSKSSSKDSIWEKYANTHQVDVKEFREIKKMQKKNGGRPITEARQSETPVEQKPTIPGIFLSEEQQRILDIIVKRGKSVFFTGSAGTGKSVLMREAIRQLRQKYKHDTERLAVTASTGLAACNISGTTLHSFAGAGLAKEPVQQLIKKASRDRALSARITR